MAPEKLPRSGLLAGMSAKQKLTIFGLIFVVILIIWQVKGLMGGNDIKTITPAPQQARQMDAKSSTAAAQKDAEISSHRTAVSADQPALHEAPVRVDPEVLEMQKKTEHSYIEHLNQLQMLKVQRDIAEANQAIASARLATVTAEKNVSDLLTKPSAPVLEPQPALPASAYSAPLANPVQQNTVVAEAADTPASPPAEPSYIVISVAMQLGRWSAVLGSEGKLYNVSVGDILPGDGSRVVSINKNVVVLEKEGKRTKISVTSSI